MPYPIKVFGRRVHAGEAGTMPVDGSGYRHAEFPEDGFVLTLNIPCVPVFVRDSDLAKLKKSDNEVEIGSWK